MALNLGYQVVSNDDLDDDADLIQVLTGNNVFQGLQ